MKMKFYVQGVQKSDQVRIKQDNIISVNGINEIINLKFDEICDTQEDNLKFTTNIVNNLLSNLNKNVQTDLITTDSYSFLKDDMLSILVERLIIDKFEIQIFIFSDQKEYFKTKIYDLLDIEQIKFRAANLYQLKVQLLKISFCCQKEFLQSQINFIDIRQQSYEEQLQYLQQYSFTNLDKVIDLNIIINIEKLNILQIKRIFVKLLQIQNFNFTQQAQNKRNNISLHKYQSQYMFYIVKSILSQCIQFDIDELVQLFNVNKSKSIIQIQLNSQQIEHVQKQNSLIEACLYIIIHIIPEIQQQLSDEDLLLSDNLDTSFSVPDSPRSFSNNLTFPVNQENLTKIKNNNIQQQERIQKLLEKLAQ